jgi:hypothetical protein
MDSVDLPPSACLNFLAKLYPNLQLRASNGNDSIEMWHKSTWKTICAEHGVPASGCKECSSRQQYKCPYCPRTKLYKSRSGLRYHITCKHSTDAKIPLKPYRHSDFADLFASLKVLAALQQKYPKRKWSVSPAKIEGEWAILEHSADGKKNWQVCLEHGYPVASCRKCSSTSAGKGSAVARRLQQLGEENPRHQFRLNATGAGIQKRVGGRWVGVCLLHGIDSSKCKICKQGVANAEERERLTVRLNRLKRKFPSMSIAISTRKTNGHYGIVRNYPNSKTPHKTYRVCEMHGRLLKNCCRCLLKKRNSKREIPEEKVGETPAYHNHQTCDRLDIWSIGDCPEEMLAFLDNEFVFSAEVPEENKFSERAEKRRI